MCKGHTEDILAEAAYVKSHQEKQNKTKHTELVLDPHLNKHFTTSPGFLEGCNKLGFVWGLENFISQVYL